MYMYFGWVQFRGGVHAVTMGPFTIDVSGEGEGGGCPKSDVVREVA